MSKHTVKLVMRLEGSAVPHASVYSQFMKKLFKHEEEIEAMFRILVDELSELLPDLGKSLAIVGKAIHP